MFKCVCAFARLLAASGTAMAAPAEGPTTLLTPRDLFSLQVASDPQISPDGSRIAYVRRSGDIMTDRMRPSIWLIDTPTGKEMPVAAGPGAPSQPRWSPDGSRLAYVSTADTEAPQLFVRWIDRGESVRITGLPTTPPPPARSPDGRQSDRLCPALRRHHDRPQAPVHLADRHAHRQGNAGRGWPRRAQPAALVP